MSTKAIEVTRKASPTALEHKRNEALKNMNANLKSAAVTMEKLEKAEGQGVIKTRFKAGEIVQAVASDEQSYGTGAVEKLAEYMGFSRSTLFERMRVAQAFTLEQAMELTEKPMANGRFLSYSHLLALSTIGNTRARSSMLNRTISEGFSVQELKLEIDTAKLGTVETGGPKHGGRSIAALKSPAASAMQTSKTMTGLKDRMVVWKESFLDAVMAMPEDAIDAALRNNTELAIGSAETAQSELEGFLSRMKECYEKIKKATDLQMAKVAKAKSEAKQEEKAMDGETKKGRRPND